MIFVFCLSARSVFDLSLIHIFCDFADAMGLDRFFYTGHSHGAGIGWHLCMNHPDRLRGFFASGSGPQRKDGKPTGSARMDTCLLYTSRGV